MARMQRRDLLRSAAGLASVAAVGSTAGCLDSVPFVGGSSGAIDSVPEDTDAVMYANVDTIREDDGVETLTNAYLEKRAESDYYEGPESYEDVLDEFEDESDIDPSQIHELTAFTEYGDNFDAEYGGAIVNAELGAEEFKDALEEADNIDFDEAERSGSVVYEPEEEGGPWVGALGDKVVIGTEDAVKDTMDVSNGDDDPLGGDLKSAYDNARDAPVKFAANMPDPEDNSSIPEETGSGDDEVDFSPLGDVETLSGAVYKDGDTRGLEVTLNAEDEDAADDVKDMLDEVKSTLEEESSSSEADEILEDISIEQNGASVTTSIKKTISELEEYIEDL